jgi:hypothetical protein
MTRSLGVNASNDLYIDKSGKLAVVSGLNAVTQACEQACKTRQGELVFDVSRGIPFFQTSLRSARGFPQFEAAIRSAILQVQDVQSIKKITITQDGEVLKYTAEIKTIYGSGAISG